MSRLAIPRIAPEELVSMASGTLNHSRICANRSGLPTAPAGWWSIMRTAQNRWERCRSAPTRPRWRSIRKLVRQGSPP